MKRYKWLKAQWPMPMQILAKKLRTKSFKSDFIDGFVLDRVRNDFIDARFFQKMELEDTIVDPFGAESKFSRVEYRKCEFRASLEGPGLELIDAPRGVQVMVSQLSEVTDFSLAISNLSVNVLEWTERIEEGLAMNGVIESAQIGSIELSPGVQAKAVVKGQTDVLEAIDLLVAKKKHTIEKLQIKFPKAHRTLLLTNTAVARFDSEPSESVLSVIRDSLSSSIMNS